MQRRAHRVLGVVLALAFALTAAPAMAQKPSTAPATPTPTGAEVVSVAGNDMFARAFPIERQGVLAGSNLAATLQTNEPRIVGNPGGHSVWFVWEPAYTRVVTLNTRSSDFDTMLAVYRGQTRGSLREVVANDDTARRLTSRVDFRAFAGNRYYVKIDGFRYFGQTAQTASAGFYVLRLLDA